MFRQCLFGAWVGVLAALSSGSATADSLFGSFLSPEDEKRIGAEQHPQILAEFGGAYDNPALARYIDSIGQFLASTSESPDIGYTFTVLDSPVVNAFALPGGYVYVTRGLLALADNEAEIAGVIAHEIGHVVARHGAERHGQGTVANLGVALLGVLTESEAVSSVAQVGAMAFIQSYSRDQEFESDTLGVRYLSRAGFDPNGMASFLSRLEAHSALQAEMHGQAAKQPGFDLFASHPRTADRVRLAIQNAGTATVNNPIVARDVYLNKINGLVFGDNPNQGLVKGERFIHPALGFRFDVPTDFRLSNGETQVVARGPNNTFVVFDLDSPEGGIPRSLVDYVTGTWFPEARFYGKEAISINRMPAATGAFRGQVQDQTMDIRPVAIAFDDRTLYRFLFISPPEKTRTIDRSFRDTAFSFRRLSANEAQAIAPFKVTIHRVRDGDTVADLASLMPAGAFQEKQFRVLNGLSESQRLERGRLVKVVTDR